MTDFLDCFLEFSDLTLAECLHERQDKMVAGNGILNFSCLYMKKKMLGWFFLIFMRNYLDRSSTNNVYIYMEKNVQDPAINILSWRSCPGTKIFIYIKHKVIFSIYKYWWEKDPNERQSSCPTSYVNSPLVAEFSTNPPSCFAT